jgi:hypothetical protein
VSKKRYFSKFGQRSNPSMTLMSVKEDRISIHTHRDKRARASRRTLLDDLDLLEIRELPKS